MNYDHWKVIVGSFIHWFFCLWLIRLQKYLRSCFHSMGEAKLMSTWISLLLKLYSLSHQQRRNNLISVEYFFKRQGTNIVIYWYRLSISLIDEAGLFPIWSSIGHSRLRQMPLCIMKWGSSVLFLSRCLSAPLHANCMLNTMVKRMWNDLLYENMA